LLGSVAVGNYNSNRGVFVDPSGIISADSDGVECKSVVTTATQAIFNNKIIIDSSAASPYAAENRSASISIFCGIVY
jgi:hypothetical protein